MKSQLVGPVIAFAALASSPAIAVGLSPLSKSGLAAGPSKAFYLTLINPYPNARTFHAYATDLADTPLARIRILPATATLAGNTNRRLIVIADDLRPGEKLEFRVCAELANQPEGTIHARVCSKLSAYRVGNAGERPGPG